MSNAILKNAIQTRSRFLLWQHTTAFFLSFLNFVGSWLLLLLFYNKEEELFFFSEKLLSFLPLFFFRGVLYSQKVTIYPIYNNRLRNARG